MRARVENAVTPPMNLSKLPLFSLISQRLGWLTERHKVLAENVANADTPNYKARDLKPVKFEAMMAAASGAGRLQPAATADRHIAPRGADAAKANAVRNNDETTLSGNSVSIEREMMKVAETATDYQLVTNLYRKQIGMIKAVIGRNQS